MGALIQQLIRDSELRMYHDYRSGSFRDWSGNNNDGTPTSIDWGGGGVRFPATTSKITVSDNTGLRLTQGAAIILMDVVSQTTTEQLISKRDFGGTNYDFYMQADGLRVYDGAAVSSKNGLTLRGHKGLAVSFNNGAVPQFYVDGLYVGDGDSANTITADNADLLIGNFALNNNNVESVVKAALVVNRVLTAAEHAQLFGELLK